MSQPSHTSPSSSQPQGYSAQQQHQQQPAPPQQSQGHGSGAGAPYPSSFSYAPPQHPPGFHPGTGFGPPPHHYGYGYPQQQPSSYGYGPPGQQTPYQYLSPPFYPTYPPPAQHPPQPAASYAHLGGRASPALASPTAELPQAVPFSPSHYTGGAARPPSPIPSAPAPDPLSTSGSTTLSPSPIRNPAEPAEVARGLVQTLQSALHPNSMANLIAHNAASPGQRSGSHIPQTLPSAVTQTGQRGYVQHADPALAYPAAHRDGLTGGGGYRNAPAPVLSLGSQPPSSSIPLFKLPSEDGSGSDSGAEESPRHHTSSGSSRLPPAVFPRLDHPSSVSLLADTARSHFSSVTTARALGNYDSAVRLVDSEDRLFELKNSHRSTSTNAKRAKASNGLPVHPKMWKPAETSIMLIPVDVDVPLISLSLIKVLSDNDCTETAQISKSDSELVVMARLYLKFPMLRLAIDCNPSLSFRPNRPFSDTRNADETLPELPHDFPFKPLALNGLRGQKSEWAENLFSRGGSFRPLSGKRLLDKYIVKNSGTKAIVLALRTSQGFDLPGDLGDRIRLAIKSDQPIDSDNDNDNDTDQPRSSVASSRPKGRSARPKPKRATQPPSLSQPGSSSGTAIDIDDAVVETPAVVITAPPDASDDQPPPPFSVDASGNAVPPSEAVIAAHNTAQENLRLRTEEHRRRRENPPVARHRSPDSFMLSPDRELVSDSPPPSPAATEDDQPSQEELRVRRLQAMQAQPTSASTIPATHPAAARLPASQAGPPPFSVNPPPPNSTYKLSPDAVHKLFNEARARTNPEGRVTRSRTSHSPGPIPEDADISVWDRVGDRAIDLWGSTSQKRTQLVDGLRARLPNRADSESPRLPDKLYIYDTVNLSGAPAAPGSERDYTADAAFGSGSDLAVFNDSVRDIIAGGDVLSRSAFDQEPNVDGHRLNVSALGSSSADEDDLAERGQSLDDAFLLTLFGLVFLEHWILPVDRLSLLFALQPDRLWTPTEVAVIYPEFGRLYHQLSIHPLDGTTPFIKGVPPAGATREAAEEWDRTRFDLSSVIMYIVRPSDLSLSGDPLRNIAFITRAIKKRMSELAAPRTQREVAFEIIRCAYFEESDRHVVDRGLEVVHRAFQRYNLPSIIEDSVRTLPLLHSQRPFKNAADIFNGSTITYYAKDALKKTHPTSYTDLCNLFAWFVRGISLETALHIWKFITAETTPRLNSKGGGIEVHFDGCSSTLEEAAERADPDHELHDRPKYPGVYASVCARELYIPSHYVSYIRCPEDFNKQLLEDFGISPDGVTGLGFPVLNDTRTFSEPTDPRPS